MAKTEKKEKITKEQRKEALGILKRLWDGEARGLAIVCEYEERDGQAVTKGGPTRCQRSTPSPHSWRPAAASRWH